MRSFVKRHLSNDKTLRNHTSYFHNIKPENLQVVVNRIIAETPDIQGSISASVAIDDDAQKIAYFVVEVKCEETISHEEADDFRNLQDALKREKLIV